MKLKWPFPLAQGLHGSGAIVLGYGVYEDGTPRIIGFLAHKILRPASDLIYEIKYRVVPKHRYNIVRTGLPPGYYDQDKRMLHACFALLGDYIEEEGGVAKLQEWAKELRAEKDTSDQADRNDEIVTIWQWWTVDRAADRARRDQMLGELFGGIHKARFSEPDENGLVEWIEPERSPEWEAKYKIFRALEDKIDADEQKMLHRLIDVRRTLWT